MRNKLRGIAPGTRTAKPALPSGFWSGARVMAAAAVCSGMLWANTPAAHAQVVEKAARKPYAIRIADYIPSENDAVRPGGTHIPAIEFDYTVQQVPDQAAVSVLSLGYIERSGLRIIPFTLSEIVRQQGATFLGRSVYFGGGIGIYSVRINDSGTSGDPKGLFGLHAIAGIDVSDSIFVDAKYHYPFKYDGRFFGGLQIGAGLRF